MSGTHDLVITLIGDDRPGLVGELSATISAQGGNWLDSSLAQLAGKFAGIVHVQCPAEQADALQAALRALPDLRVVAEASQPITLQQKRQLNLTLVGHDRVGIVAEFTGVLARRQVNVESLETWTSSAPMSGDTLFHAEAALTAPANLDARALKDELEALSAELVVDITLDEIVEM